MVEQGREGAVTGVEFGDRALPIRSHSSVRRRQWTNRPRAGVVGALPPRVRLAPHFFRRRVLLGRSPAVLRCFTSRASRGRQPDRVARVYGRRSTTDVGAGLAHSGNTGSGTRKARPAAQAGEPPATASGQGRLESAGNLGWPRRIQTGSDRLAASTHEGGFD